MPPADGGAAPVPVTPRLLRGWPLPEPDEGGDKHSRGTVLVAGGAASTPGAVLLAGLAALRAGAGRLQLATVAACAPMLGVTLPEAGVLGLAADDDGSLAAGCADALVDAACSASALVLGPGLLGPGARGLLRGVLPRLPPSCAVVLDAVGLTALAREPSSADGLGGRLVLTPNSGELQALGGDPEQVARRFGAVVAARGQVVAPDGRRWRDEAGGIGLGTSGSGDVLAGLVGGLLARGCPPEQAAVWGQYAHAAAGDRLAARLGRTGFLARELLDELAPVLTGLRG